MNQRGLTLAEVLMAAGLLATVLILLVGVFLGGLRLMQRSEVHTGATSIAREVLEVIEDKGGFGALPDTDIGIGQGVVFNGANPDPAIDGFPPLPYPKAERDGREFLIRVETRNLGSSSQTTSPKGNRHTIVLVTVSWEEGRVQLEKGFHAANTSMP